MRELSGGACLAAEALAKIGRLRALGRQDLDRNETIEGGLAREVHRPHAAPAEKAFYMEGVVDRGLEAFAQRVSRPGVRTDGPAAARAEPAARGHGGRAGRAGQEVMAPGSKKSVNNS